MKYKILSIMTVFLTYSPAFANDEICQELLEYEAQVNLELPKMVDEITEVHQVQINCDNKTVLYRRKIFGLGLFPDGWQERKQRQHTQFHCNKKGVASKSLWTVMDTIIDENYNYVATLITRPNDCP